MPRLPPAGAVMAQLKLYLSNASCHREPDICVQLDGYTGIERWPVFYACGHACMHGMRCCACDGHLYADNAQCWVCVERSP